MEKIAGKTVVICTEIESLIIRSVYFKLIYFIFVALNVNLHRYTARENTKQTLRQTNISIKLQTLRIHLLLDLDKFRHHFKVIHASIQLNRIAKYR